MMKSTTALDRVLSIRNAGAAFLLAFALAPVAGCVAGTIEDPIGDANEEDVRTAGMSWEEFLGVVYQEPDTGIYIVNGDQPIESLRDLQTFYNENVREGQLIVHQANGVDAKWSAAQQTNITYCVSQSSFGSSRYSTAVNAMNAAAGAWEAVANVNFVHSTNQDGSCTSSNNNVVFNVRLVNSGGAYLARAFFPNQGRSAREVLIDTSAFGNLGAITLAGVLRHELGHVLGFRHEHTRPEAGKCFEDNNWRSLTTYDAASVMHYPQCNGSNQGDLAITQKDKDGTASLYGAPGGGGGGGGATCAHDKCVTGAPLSAAVCDSVVQAVCAADAYCCSTSWDAQCVNQVYTVGKSMVCSKGSCAHNVCTTGVKLAKGCDPHGVVTTICNADPFCCGTQWDAQCVGEVSSIAGKNCK
jgi:predicted SprT family Zn-dependent metalloprotease